MFHDTPEKVLVKKFILISFCSPELFQHPSGLEGIGLTNTLKHPLEVAITSLQNKRQLAIYGNGPTFSLQPLQFEPPMAFFVTFCIS